MIGKRVSWGRWFDHRKPMTHKHNFCYVGQQRIIPKIYKILLSGFNEEHFPVAFKVHLRSEPSLAQGE